MKSNGDVLGQIATEKAPREGQDKLIQIKWEKILRPDQVLAHFLPMDSANCGLR